MATSGTYTFTVTRDDTINSALRIIKAQGDRDVAVGSRLANAAAALNIMVKSWVMEGLPLWAVLDVAVPMVVGQAQYSLGPGTSTQRPLRILDAYLRDASGNDVSLQVTSRYDWDTLGQKSSPGIPNQIFYDPQLNNGIVTVYNVPSDATHTMHLVIQRQFQDFNLSTDSPDFPQEAYQALKYCLAEELYPELGDLNNQVLFQFIVGKARAAKDALFAFGQEWASVTFTPTERS
jgi:hypothetical protein